VGDVMLSREGEKMQEIILDTQNYLDHNSHIGIWKNGSIWTGSLDVSSFETERKLLNLWEIMKPVGLVSISSIFTLMATMIQIVSAEPKDGKVQKMWRSQIIEILSSQAEFLCNDLDLPESLQFISRLKDTLNERDSVTNQEILVQMCCLRDLMQSEMTKHFSLTIPDSLVKYYKQGRLFGDAVFTSFPTARFDIKEAGTCLACGCNTAAGFHLMRAAEIGLWELGKDRQIELSKTNKIEFTEWGVIIGELEGVIALIKQWPNSPSKEDAHKFYNSAIVEVRAFNDGWRRHIAHVRKYQQPLHDDEALALFGHVKRFLENLATRISEGNYTPLVW